MKSGHITAPPAIAEQHPGIYTKVTPDGTELHRCLQCGAWLVRGVGKYPCSEGVELVVGLKYAVLVPDDPDLHTAMLLREPGRRLQPCWVVYDNPQGSETVTFAPNEIVSVVDLKVDHAHMLWDAIADTVVLPEGLPAEVPDLAPAKLTPRADGTVCDDTPDFTEED